MRSKPPHSGQVLPQPRWARDIDDANWARLVDLLQDGTPAIDVLIELELPRTKLRSLQLLAEKFGPRRRLLAFATFREALANSAAENAGQFGAALERIARLAVSDNVAEATQVRAIECMRLWAETLGKHAAADAETLKAEEAAATPAASIDDAVQAVLRAYGMDAMPKHAGNGQRATGNGDTGQKPGATGGMA